MSLNLQCHFCENATKVTKRCSKCHTSLYCSRKCQVNDWPNHKLICDQLFEEYTRKRGSEQLEDIDPSNENPRKKALKTKDSEDKTKVRIVENFPVISRTYGQQLKIRPLDEETPNDSSFYQIFDLNFPNVSFIEQLNETYSLWKQIVGFSGPAQIKFGRNERRFINVFGKSFDSPIRAFFYAKLKSLGLEIVYNLPENQNQAIQDNFFETIPLNELEKYLLAPAKEFTKKVADLAGPEKLNVITEKIKKGKTPTTIQSQITNLVNIYWSNSVKEEALQLIVDAIYNPRDNNLFCNLLLATKEKKLYYSRIKSTNVNETRLSTKNRFERTTIEFLAINTFRLSSAVEEAKKDPRYSEKTRDEIVQNILENSDEGKDENIYGKLLQKKKEFLNQEKFIRSPELKRMTLFGEYFFTSPIKIELDANSNINQLMFFNPIQIQPTFNGEAFTQNKDGSITLTDEFKEELQFKIGVAPFIFQIDVKLQKPFENVQTISRIINFGESKTIRLEDTKQAFIEFLSNFVQEYERETGETIDKENIDFVIILESKPRPLRTLTNIQKRFFETQPDNSEQQYHSKNQLGITTYRFKQISEPLRILRDEDEF